jgi:hypothetical protein
MVRGMEPVVGAATAVECPTAVVAASTTWDEFPTLWGGDAHDAVLRWCAAQGLELG